MRKSIKKIFLPLFIAAFMLSFSSNYILPSASAATYTPAYTNVKIGLYYSSSALDSANLQNVTGYGVGYRFGYFDGNRSFADIGAYTSETKITMLRDMNMYYNSSDNTYYSGSSGSVVVGCYHIQLETAYGTYGEARTAADTFVSVNAFVKYEDGAFYVCAGEYTTEADASAAAAGLAIQQNYSITSGTSYTVCVVATGTDEILFEFDCGTDSRLGVMPVSADGAKCQTWFKGYRYYGGFQYARLSGGSMTVSNILDIEDYVKGVVPWEMVASWPVEALKAQAICARTYAVANFNKHSQYGFDLCNTTDCQVYCGVSAATDNSNAAVDQTAGQYLLYNGKLATAFYMSCDGGATENSENVWNEAIGYLVGVTDPYEAAVADRIDGYSWTKTYTNSDLTTLLQGKSYSIGTIVNFQITQFTNMGNVYKITFTDSSGKTLSFSKEKVRTVLGLSSIRYTLSGVSGGTVYVNSPNTSITGSLSSYYVIGGGEISSALPSGTIYAITGSGTVSEVNTGTSGTSSSGTYTITGTGKGHNVGMSQWGAYSMAKNYGKTCADILSFYYQGTTIAYS